MCQMLTGTMPLGGYRTLGRQGVMPKAQIEQAIEEFRKGKFVIIADDEDRENEGDLCMAAESVTPEAINFMAKFARGLICQPIVKAVSYTHLTLPTIYSV